MRPRTKTERERAQEFALVLPVVLGLLAAVFYWGPLWLPQKPRLALGLLVAAPAVSAVAVILPPVWLRLFRAWMLLAEGLSWLMTRVILTVFYFVVLTPIGLLMRVLGKRPLDVRWKDGKSSYWVEKKPVEFTLERYGKQY